MTSTAPHLPAARPRLLARLARRALVLACAGAATALPAAPAVAGTANAGLPGASASNPLAGVTWGPYYVPDRTDPGFDPPSWLFNTSSGADKVAFGRILAEPRFRWFGDWYPTYDEGNVWGARTAITDYIRYVTRGDPSVGVQAAVFRLSPFEHAACGPGGVPTAAQQDDYRAWIREFAAGIGSTRMALVLQPDMPFTLCLPHRSQVDLKLVAYAARTFSALPHTTVYLDAGAADWLGLPNGRPLRPGDVATMLARAGVASTRGFALDLTHFDATSREVAFGKTLIRLLARKGIRNMHIVVNTAQNGRAFTPQAHWRAFKQGIVCRSVRHRFCVTLGRPPTTRTGDPAVDAYLWIGRPWINNDTRRGYDETLRLVTTSPYLAALPSLDVSALPDLPSLPTDVPSVPSAPDVPDVSGWLPDPYGD